MSVSQIVAYLFPVCCFSPRSKRREQKLMKDQESMGDIKIKAACLRHLEQNQASCSIIPPIEECHLPLSQGHLITPSEPSMHARLRYFIIKNQYILKDYNDKKHA
jgi:hypothetical protein